PNEPWFAHRDAAAYGIVLDPHCKIAWGCGDIGDDPIVVVLTENVSDAHLPGLRDDGVSYIFAGERALDLGRVLDILSRELGIERLEVNGVSRMAPSFARVSWTRSVSRFSLRLTALCAPP